MISCVFSQITIRASIVCFVLPLLVLLSYFCCRAQQSDWAILTRCADILPVTVTDIDEGTSWTIPHGHMLQPGQRSGGLDLFFMQTYLLYDFGNGLLPIQGPDGWYLLDKRGNTVMHAGGQYSSITAPSGGFHRAYETIDGQGVVCFLGTDGKEAFAGKKLKWATEFNEGYAVIRTVEEPDSWQIMHSSGRIVARIPADIAPYVTNASPVNDGILLITTRRARGYDRQSFVYQHHYFDTLARHVLDVKKVFGNYPEYTPSPFRHGMSVYHHGATVIFDTSGSILKQLDVAAYTYTTTSRYLFLSNGSRWNMLFDHSLNPVALPAAPHHKTECRFVSENYMLVTSTDTLSRVVTHIVLDAADLHELYRTKEPIITIKDDMVLLGNSERDGGISKIENLQGRTVYSTPPELRVFSSVETARPFASQVRHLELSRPESISSLDEFKNLLTLDIYGYDGNYLPVDFNALKELRTLTVSSCTHLQQLPGSVKNLGKLEKLNIMNCNSISNIEDFIPALSALRFLYTQNYDFPPGFVEKMKIDRPSLSIEAWEGLDFIDQSIDETSPVRKPKSLPPPNPQKN